LVRVRHRLVVCRAQVIMKIKVDTAGLGQSRWYEYLVRFAFGGVVTALAGIVAKHYGPVIGGLFLAFPAIFPASATLLEKHEKEKKERVGMNGEERGRAAAAIDAAGAAMGSIGLGAFGLIVWLALPKFSTGLVLAVATIAWLLTAILIWEVREKVGRRLLAKA
jgi:hypothetical protein